MSTGLVIGKFYPPHLGHQHLLDVAQSQVDELDVIVCEHPSQVLSGELRAGWLRQMCPSAKVHVIEDFGDDDNSQAWATATMGWLRRSPDVVFTSESYGERYAELMGAHHVAVDPERVVVPVSSTAIRADMAANWNMLPAPVRAYFATRVAIVGAESTGTTTLAKALASHYDTAWVPEYGRAYSEAKLAEGTFAEDQWSTDDFVTIALEQQRQEDELALSSGPILICDTDALATAIWHERYMSARSPEVEAIASSRRYPLTILTSDDIPFEQDGLRDGEHLRAWMTQRFREALIERDDHWIEVAGSLDERLAKAVAVIDALPGWWDR